MTRGATSNLDPGQHLEVFSRTVNLPKACDPRSRTRPGFCFTLKTSTYKVNLPKACDSRSQTRPRFCLTLRTSTYKVNLPKACDPEESNKAEVLFNT